MNDSGVVLGGEALFLIAVRKTFRGVDGNLGGFWEVSVSRVCVKEEFYDYFTIWHSL